MKVKIAKVAFPCTNMCKAIPINATASSWVTENKFSVIDHKHFNY